MLCNAPFEKRKGEKKQSFYSRPRFGGRKANLRCNIAGRSKLALFSKANRFQKHIVTESVTRFSVDVNRKFTFFAAPRFFAVLAVSVFHLPSQKSRDHLRKFLFQLSAMGSRRFPLCDKENAADHVACGQNGRGHGNGHMVILL